MDLVPVPVIGSAAHPVCCSSTQSKWRDDDDEGDDDQFGTLRSSEPAAEAAPAQPAPQAGAALDLRHLHAPSLTYPLLQGSLI